MLPGNNDMVGEGIPRESTTSELDRFGMKLHHRMSKRSVVGRRGVNILCDKDITVLPVVLVSLNCKKNLNQPLWLI